MRDAGIVRPHAKHCKAGRDKKQNWDKKRKPTGIKQKSAVQCGGVGMEEDISAMVVSGN